MTLRRVVAGLAPILLLLGCGGGGTSGNSTPPPPAPPTPDFSITVSSAAITITAGSSGNTSVTVTPLNGFSGVVDISVAGFPAGVSASPLQISAGSSGTLILNVSSSVATGTYSGSVKGQSGTTSHTVAASLKVPITLGGETLSHTYDATIPASAQTYLDKLWADATSPGYFYDMCGSASESVTLTVGYDPAQSFHFSTNPSPSINIHQLPAPNAQGEDTNFDFAYIHENGHALRAFSSFLPPFTKGTDPWEE